MSRIFGCGTASNSFRHRRALIALMAYDLGPRRSANLAIHFFATGARSRVGARPVYPDIDPVTFNFARPRRQFLEKTGTPCGPVL
jgi:hypothetical protein